MITRNTWPTDDPPTWTWQQNADGTYTGPNDFTVKRITHRNHPDRWLLRMADSWEGRPCGLYLTYWDAFKAAGANDRSHAETTAPDPAPSVGLDKPL